MNLRAIRRLSLGIVCAACAEFIIATTGVQIRELPHSTDFASYWFAGQLAHEGRSPYDQAEIVRRGRALGFTHDQFPFLYPPPFALAMQPLARLSYPRARQVWMLLTTLEVLALVGVTALFMRALGTELGIEDPSLYWVLLGAFVPAALNSTSLQTDIRAGSVGILLDLLLTLLAWAMLRRRTKITALALALATLAKLTPAALLPYAWWRGARRAAWQAVALLALSMLPAFVHWGWWIVPDYLQSGILPSLHNVDGWAHNQSLDAVLTRFFDQSAMDGVPATAPLAKHVLSAVLTVAIVIYTLRVLRTRNRPAVLLPAELGFVVLTILMLMKLTWVHTLTAMLFVWPALLLPILRAAELGAPWARRAGIATCAGVFLSAAHLPVLWGEHWRGPLVVVTGAHLYGMLLLWGTTCFVLRRAPEILVPSSNP
jgi:hypothetical protein